MGKVYACTQWIINTYTVQVDIMMRKLLNFTPMFVIKWSVSEISWLVVTAEKAQHRHFNSTFFLLRWVHILQCIPAIIVGF